MLASLHLTALEDGERAMRFESPTFTHYAKKSEMLMSYLPTDISPLLDGTSLRLHFPVQRQVATLPNAHAIPGPSQLYSTVHSLYCTALCSVSSVCTDPASLQPLAITSTSRVCTATPQLPQLQDHRKCNLDNPRYGLQDNRNCHVLIMTL